MNVHQLHCSYILLLAVLLLPCSSSQSSSSAAEVNNSVTPSSFNPPAPNGTRVILRRLWSAYTTTTVSATGWTEGQRPTWTSQASNNSPGPMMTNDFSKVRPNHPPRQTEDEEEEEDDDEEEEEEEGDVEDEDDDEEEEDEVDDDEDNEPNKGPSRRQRQRQHNDVESWIQSHKLYSSSSSSVANTVETHPTPPPAPGGPIISSIRHHKSRKTFTRTRKVKHSDKKGTGSSATTPSQILFHEQGDQPMLESKSIHSSSSSPVGGIRKLFSPLPPTETREEPGGFMPVNNDTRMVYGKPYFSSSSSSKKHNATSLNRIKTFLLRNSSSVSSSQQRNGKQEEPDTNRDISNGQLSAEKIARIPVAADHEKGFKSANNSPTSSHLPPPTNRKTTEKTYEESYQEEQGGGGGSTFKATTTSSRAQSSRGRTNRRLKSKQEQQSSNNNSSDSTASSATTKRNRNKGIKASNKQDDNQNLNSQEENGKLRSSAGNRGGSRRKLERQEEKKKRKQQSRLLASGLASSGELAGDEQNPSTQIVQGLLESTTTDYGLNVNRSGDWWWDDKRRNDEERVNVPGIGGNEQRDHEEDLSPSYFPGSERAAGEEDSDVSGNSNKTAGKSLFNDYGLLGSDEESRDVLQASSPTDETSASAPLSSSPSSSAAATSIGLSTASKTKPDIDIVTKFLRIVETQHTLGDNCTAGTAFSLGEGVVDRYAQERFRLEAEIAVNRANMLTRLWKYAPAGVLDSEYLLHASLFSMVEFDDDIFAAGNCYDKLQYKNYTLFCPFAYRLPEGNILVKDLAVEYKYLSNTSEWFYIARKNAERVIKNHNQFSRGFHSYTYNESTHTDRVQDEILNVTYDDGKWSKPYFDCGGGNIWMMTYTVPFFGFKDDHYFFKGTSGIDIDLRRVDIDQCPLPENSTELNIFAASDKCKNATTKCIPIKGLGFRRGSYRCECQPGYYFPNTSSTVKYFNGTVLEEEYEKKLLNEETMYDEEGAFECLKCLEGCDTCVDDRPCVVTLNWLMRTAILILQCAIIAMLPIVGLFTWKYSDIKVVRAASPVLLRFIVLGAFLIYCTILVLYPSPSVITCTIRVWLREIGFSLAYGALMLKTWRISVIFRVRSAKAVKITDLDLMKRLGVIVAIFTALLVIRTLVAPPVAIISLTADDLKAWLCKTDWWDHSFTIMELLFLVWGIRLCIVVRKAPSEFNESKFISLAIYNEFLLSVFLNISMLFLQSPANPDLLYIIFFCHVQLTMTLLLCLIFGSKAYMVFRGHGKGNALDETRVPTFISKNRSGQKPKQPSVQNSTTGVHSSTTSTSHDPNFNSRLSEDVQEEFRRLYYQLEELKERNMRFGNRHLVAKIRAMQEAADSILGTTGSGMTQANCHLQPGLEIRGRDGGNGATSSGPDGGGAGPSSNNDKGSSSNVLSDITEEEGGNGGGASDKGGKDGGKKGKRLSFLGRVKSPKGFVSSRCKSAGSSPSSSKNSSSGSETSGSASPMTKKGGLAGSKSAQQAGGSGVSKRNSDECGAETKTKPEEDDEDDSVLLAHGGVYIGEVKSDRPPAKGTPVRGNTQPKPPPSSSEPLPSTSSQTNGCSQQQQPLLTSVQVHPLSGEGASVKEDEHVRRSALKDDDELSTAAVTCNKGAGMMNTCDYFQSRNDQGNCSKDCEQEEGEEYIPLNLIRRSSSVTTTTEGESTSVTAVVVRSASSNSSSTTTATETPPAKSSSVNDNVTPSSSVVPTSSSDKNPSAGENQNNKILLDLNDKSRFTEEITV